MTESVFIDESGDLGLHGSRFMVLSALIVENPQPLNRVVKNMRRNKFKKELMKASEIKANHSSKEVIQYMLSKLNELRGVRVLYVVLEKKKLLSDYLKNDNHRLYNYVAGRLARNISFIQSTVEIRIDKSKGKQILQEDFNTYFMNSLDQKYRCRIKLISHSHSHCWAGLQFADVLAWACFQKFEHDNSEYLDILKVEQEVYHVW